MATAAQIAANRINAQASTGPTTEAGLARASRNALSSGLYSRGDFVLPGEQPIYAEFCASFQSDLEPEGAIEQTLSAEIIHSAWRMRRCSAIAAALTGPLDPMVDPAVAQTQQSVDRARNDAHRTFQRAIAELRRLQTERQFRLQSFPADFDSTTLGLASFKDIAPALKQTINPARVEAPTSKTNPAPKHPLTIRTQSGVAQFPRNSPCVCGSGIKFKRCCGKGAPAVLNLAA